MTNKQYPYGTEGTHWCSGCNCYKSVRMFSVKLTRPKCDPCRERINAKRKTLTKR